MKRRDFFKGTAAGLLLGSCPTWLNRAFAASPPSVPDAISKAWKRAQEYGKPLLVLVVPSKPTARYTRSNALGAFINNAPPKDMALLTLTEVVCADIATLSKSLSLALDPSHEPWMILVDHYSHALKSISINPSLPPLPRLSGGRGIPTPKTEVAYNAAIDAHNKLLGDALRTALTMPSSVLRDRAKHARKSLNPTLVAKVEANTPLSPEETSQAASTLDLKLHQKSLSDVAITNLRKMPPEGTYWASNWGCGTEIEGHPEMGDMVDCGMGHVPAKSRRFLHFFADVRPPRGSR